jgi:Cu2+-exporting ATPase
MSSKSSRTAVLEVTGVQWASSKAVAEAVLSRRPGVQAVDANPVAQTAAVTYDADRTSVAELAGWIRDCGYHCDGMSVPNHLCDPLAEPPSTTPSITTMARTTQRTAPTPLLPQRATTSGTTVSRPLASTPEVRLVVLRM